VLDRPALVTLFVFFVIPAALLALVVWILGRSAATRRQAAHLAANEPPAVPPAGEHTET
jgi:hypothetical protein